MYMYCNVQAPAYYAYARVKDVLKNLTVLLEYIHLYLNMVSVLLEYAGICL